MSSADKNFCCSCFCDGINSSPSLWLASSLNQVNDQAQQIHTFAVVAVFVVAHSFCADIAAHIRQAQTSTAVALSHTHLQDFLLSASYFRVLCVYEGKQLEHYVWNMVITIKTETQIQAVICPTVRSTWSSSLNQVNQMQTWNADKIRLQWLHYHIWT